MEGADQERPSAQCQGVPESGVRDGRDWDPSSATVEFCGLGKAFNFSKSYSSSYTK